MVSNNCINSFILVEFPSKNFILNFSKFSGGIGLSILVRLVVVIGGGLAINVFCGMCKVTG